MCYQAVYCRFYCIIIMVYCAAYGCKNDSRKINVKDSVSYHRFPKDEKLLREWLAKIACADFTPTEESRPCSQHFEPHCYKRDLKAELLGLPEKYDSKPDAIPTVFVYRPTKRPRPSSEMRNQKKERKEVSLLASLRIKTRR